MGSSLLAIRKEEKLVSRRRMNKKEYFFMSFSFKNKKIDSTTKVLSILDYKLL